MMLSTIAQAGRQLSPMGHLSQCGYVYKSYVGLLLILWEVLHTSSETEVIDSDTAYISVYILRLTHNVQT